MITSLRDRILARAIERGLFDPPGLVLLAVSGGPDSVALLDLMSAVSEELNLTLAVAHVVHGISAEATEAAPHVEELAAIYNVPFYKEELALGPDASETTARRVRYQCLRAIQERIEARYLATGHHEDDQLETVLYRFLRGSGTAGLAGIPEKGPDGLVRPLLGFRKEELEDWVAERRSEAGNRPPVFVDPANADDRHDRSWIRHALLPTLRERFGPEVDSRLVQTGVQAAKDNAAWSAVLESLPGIDFRRISGGFEVARVSLGRYDKLLSERLLRVAARDVGCRLTRRQAAQLLEFAIEGVSGRQVQLGSGWVAATEFDRLKVSRPVQGEPDQRLKVELVEGGEGCFSWCDWEFNWQCREVDAVERDSNTTWIPYGECEVRAPEHGDRIRPLGGVGTKKVRRVLMEARVPAEERQLYPLVLRRETVLWIPGVCRSDFEVPQIGDLAVQLEACAG